jgi:hypothetical protein
MCGSVLGKAAASCTVTLATGKVAIATREEDACTEALPVSAAARNCACNSRHACGSEAAQPEQVVHVVHRRLCHDVAQQGKARALMAEPIVWQRIVKALVRIQLGTERVMK